MSDCNEAFRFEFVQPEFDILQTTDDGNIILIKYDYDFSYVNFRKKWLFSSRFNNCHFFMCNMTNCIFSNCTFNECKFNFCILTPIRFVDCKFNNCSFDGVHTSNESEFIDCDFSGSIFSENTSTMFGLSLYRPINFPEHCFKLACPKEGSFIAYKKAHGYLITLYIPAYAKRSSAFTNKCRCDIAEVVDIVNIKNDYIHVKEIQSQHDSNFIYRVVEMVSVDNFDNNRFHECSTGIHFFMTKQEAIDYQF